jgi:(p)ppGpp synthase/HD superfamily hydrolase
MKILRDEFGISDPEILAAALLHDVLEDTDARLEELILRFGERVAGLVVLLTKDNSLPRSERDRVYFARLEAGPLEARICKIADSLHNFRDSDEKLRPKAFRKAKDLFLLFWDTPELNAELRILARELFG